MSGENVLQQNNQELHKETLQTISHIKASRDEYGYVDFQSYTMNRFLKEIYDVIKNIDEAVQGPQDIELTFVDRNKFDADICIKFPSLLQKFRKEYTKEIIPKIIELLETSDLLKQEKIVKVESIGIYINITLGNQFLFSTLSDIFDKGIHYGENDTHKGESVLVDYSSPNVAKHLHAGHIRSTIIGHVLSNLYEVNGYYTHRVNHINDWGGFGYLIQGYEQWENILPTFQNKNDLLFFIYSLYRKGEKISSSLSEYEQISASEKQDLGQYYGNFSSYDEFVLQFQKFVESSKQTFHNLEIGAQKEVTLWKQMVEWSLSDFNGFYNLLNIHQDYVIGESFYADYGVKLVEKLEKDGEVILYSEKDAQKDIGELENLLQQEKITQKAFDILKEEIVRDIGAYVVLLENFERFVVLKGDKSSIYATRDFGAIQYRVETFSPSRIVYEVGQEQAEHFDKLFKSAKKIGFNNIQFTHVYHGFYVDSKTKKKLSSRDGASNVQKLLQESITFFKNKYNTSEFSQSDIDDISYKLAIGSIIFNDIRSDKKNPVLISSDIQETCEAFEESGGAYVMYAIVRAKSILSKISPIQYTSVFQNTQLDNIEKILLNEFNRFPFVIQQAQENDNPSTLAEYVLHLARYYNSYYNSHRVISGDEVIQSRVFITQAFILIAKKALNICHIQVPDKI